MNEHTNQKIIEFEDYCKYCKYCDYPEEADPCYRCIEVPARYEASKPLCFEPKEDKGDPVDSSNIN